MDVSSIINSSSTANQNVSISAIKKAENVQETQMQGILQGLEKSNPPSQLAAASTGVGSNLNISA